jgi:D-beta-D-heptose 7-phosphate kinase/D-beta-D-heptose 1-phosphate adenosyltransferase
MHKAASNTNSNLLDLCRKFEKTRILVIGDVILDKFVYGSVDRISPESPVPVLALKRENKMLGGAGNTLANLAGLTVKAELIAVIGADNEGEQLRELLGGLNVSPDNLVVDATRPTSVKTRFLAGHQQLLRSDFEKSDSVDDAVARKILEKFNALKSKIDAVIVSDYGKGVLRADVISAIIAGAKESNIPVIVDPKGSDYTKYKGATAVTPNKKELSEAVNGATLATDADVEQAANRLIKECGVQNVIATRSAEGISVISPSEGVHHIRQEHTVEVYDVSGAGDTVIATITASLAAGASFESAAYLANQAGSIAVTKVGTTPIRLEELLDALQGANIASSSRLYQAPLQSVEAAIEDINRWRAQNLKVGFTNGCFDIVHAGHVTYLNEARAQCDRLIVALNSDSSVRVLKGPERPVHDEKARATVLGALASVDMVILFGAKEQGQDNTANTLLEQLRPDIYFKGGDYKVEEIPEAPIVQAYGGIVKVLSNVEGYSTTNAIKKIRKTDAA